MIRKRVLMALLFLSGSLLSAGGGHAASFDGAAIPAGVWVDIPTTGEAAPKVFHGGGHDCPRALRSVFFRL